MPYRSVRMCWKAPRTFNERWLPRASSDVATRFTATPTQATTNTGTPRTCSGWTSRWTASTRRTTPTTSNVTPLAAADNISARLSPYDQVGVEGRRARFIAQIAPASAPTSVSM